MVKKRFMKFIAAVLSLAMLATIAAGCQKETPASPTVESIEITAQPTKTSYIVGDAFSTVGMVVTAAYSDGTKQEVTEYSYSPAGALEAGATKVVITYAEKTAEVTITVSERAVSSITIKTPPDKTKYVEGEAFDRTGMVVTANFNDGSSLDVTDYTVTPSNKLTSQTDKVVVTYMGKTADVAVTVEAKTVTKLELTAPPSKKSYIAGQPFSTSGMVITATFNDGTSAAVLGYTVEPAGGLEMGTSSVVVTFGGKSVTVEGITVEAKALTTIAVTNPPAKTVYEAGSAFSPAGMVITATYNDGDKKIIPLKEGEADGYTYSPDGALTDSDVKVIVSYGGKTCEQQIEVSKALTSISVDTPPAKVKYVEGQKFSADGMVVTAHYSDGTDGTITSYTVDIERPLTITDTVITVSYLNKTAAVNITVAAKTVTGIEVTKQPAAVKYVVGQKFNPAGMEVTAVYNDGSAKVIPLKEGDKEGYVLGANAASLAAEDTAVSITYVSVATTVSVAVRTVKGIAITAPPARVSYVAKERFDTAGMVVTATLSDDTTLTVEPDSTGVNGYTYTPDGQLSVADTAVTVSFKTKTAAQAITVVLGFAVEAEDALIKSTGAKFMSNNAEASGGVYLGDLKIGDEMICKFTASAAGTATIAFRAASGYLIEKNGNSVPTKMGDTQLNKVADITINGSPITMADTVVLQGSENAQGSWDLYFNWTDVEFAGVPVQKGVNTLSFKFKDNDLITAWGAKTTGNIDGFRVSFDGGVTGAAISGSKKATLVSETDAGLPKLSEMVAGKTKAAVEAELSEHGSGNVENNGSLSGGQGVGSMNGPITFKFTLDAADADGTLELLASPARWTQETGGNTSMLNLDDHIRLVINGEMVRLSNVDLIAHDKNNWWELYSIVVDGVGLKDGENVVIIEKIDGGLNVDCLNVYTAIAALPVYPPAA